MSFRVVGLILVALAAISGAAIWLLQPVESRASYFGAEDGGSAGRSCDETLEAVGTLNGPALFQGFVACAEGGRVADANYLIIAGQVRSMADMMMLKPRGDADTQKAAALYGDIYSKYGGLGFAEFYRSPANVDAIDARVRGTDLGFREGYDPGWAYKETSKTSLYAKLVENARANRIWQMRNFALTIQNDEYYALYQAAEKLRAETGGVFHEGSPAAEEHDRLTREMAAIAATIPQLPQPKDTTPYAELMAEEPEQADQKVAVGYNGPAEETRAVLTSEAAVRQSWLAAALSDEALEALISKTDFSTQVLIVVGHGERRNASGKIIISASHRRGSYAVDTRVGVIPGSCGVESAISYPFAVAVTEAVSGDAVRSFSTMNFPDECGPAVSGAPVLLK